MKRDIRPARASGVSLDIVTSLSAVAAADWNRLAGDDPLVSHAFLSALERAGCVGGNTGWAPRHVLLQEDGRLAGALPLYLKSHSYGEYVFDWAWADAYDRHGLQYYPKLVAAVPFTPVTGRRLLADTDAHRETLIRGALQLARELEVSSLHVLFPTPTDAQALANAGLMQRRGVQFHWRNADYPSFDDFLAAMNHAKRKNIRQERRKVRDAGVTFEWLEGAAITSAHWRYFTRCYRNTYRAHGSRPYLNFEFFEEIGATLAPHVLLILAQREGKPVAASLNIRAADRLCGRYWGSTEYEPGLHFETCYYQAIEYCIARGVPLFEGGAQGEHKMARGLLPVETFSAHWLAHPQFAEAVENFLAREGRGMAHYVSELNERTPFRRNDDA